MKLRLKMQNGLQRGAKMQVILGHNSNNFHFTISIPNSSLRNKVGKTKTSNSSLRNKVGKTKT